MKEKILLIDDNDEWRRFAVRELTSVGFDVFAPEDLANYCTIWNLREQLNEFDLIIVDAVLQEADAIDIIYRIKEAGINDRQNYIRSTISLSASIDIDTVVRYMKLGIRSISPKPYDPTTLISIVNSAIREVNEGNNGIQ